MSNGSLLYIIKEFSKISGLIKPTKKMLVQTKFLVLVFVLMVENIRGDIDIVTYDVCEKVLGDVGINIETYPKTVAHGIHSINVESIRQIFEPNFSEDNDIPTVNLNFTSPDGILPYAPLAGYDTTLKSFPFQLMDFIFSKDHPEFYTVKDTTVEKLGHAMHMLETWTRALPEYNRLKSEPPTDDQFCKCLAEVLHQDILKSLEKVLFGVQTRQRVGRTGKLISIEDNKQWDTIDDNKQWETRKRREVEKWQPGTVNNSELWPQLRTMLDVSMPSTEEIRMLASYLFCKIN